MGALARLLPIVATALVGVAHAFAWRSTSPAATWVVIAVAYLPLVVLSLVVLARDEVLRDTFQLVAGDISRGIGAAAAMVAVVTGAGLLALKVAPEIAVKELSAVLQLRAAVPVEWQRGLAVVTLAAAEEIVFRGALTHVLEERFGSARAPWVASALYAIAMLPALRPSVIFAAIVVAVATAFVVARWRRPLVAIIAHAAFTWVAIELVAPILWARALQP